MASPPMSDAPLTHHLAEIRFRLIVCLACLTGVFAVAWIRLDLLLAWVLFPLHTVAPTVKLAALSITEGFFATVRLAAFASLAVCLPIFLWHVWRFVEPGLFEREKTWCRLLLLPALVSFYLGGAFCYFVALPAALRFLLQVLAGQVMPVFSIMGYIDFVFFFLAAMGTVFEFPLLVAFLDALDLVPVERLRENRRYGVVAAFIIGAIASPPDAVSQCLVAIPLLILQEVGIWFTVFLRRWHPRTEGEKFPLSRG